MSDIEVIFATNAAAVAADIDKAKAATAQATVVAEKQIVVTERVTRSSDSMAKQLQMSTKALRGIGLAAGLAGAEFGGAIGKVAGLATAGASIGGPWGAAIGAGIGLVSAGINAMGGSAEDAVKKIVGLRESLSSLADKRAQIQGQAAAEAGSTSSKYAKDVKELITSGVDVRYRLTATKESGLSTEEIVGLMREGYSDREINQAGQWSYKSGDSASDIARAQRARKGYFSEMFGSVNGMDSTMDGWDKLDRYREKTLQELLAPKKAENASETQRLYDLLNGSYSESIKATAASTDGLLTLLRGAIEGEKAMRVRVTNAEQELINSSKNGAAALPPGGTGTN